METRLKLVLRNQTLRLAFRGVVFFLLLFLVKAGEFKLIPVLLFLTGASALYLRPLFRTIEFLAHFISLLSVSLLAARFLSEDYFLFADLILSFFFFLLLGIKDLALIQRAAWYRFLNLGLIYSFLVLFFFSNQDYFISKLLLLFFAVLFLTRDFLKKRIYYWLTAFLMLESVWAISLLPIGFISSANLGILIYFILTELGILNLENKLTRRKILTYTSIFVVLLLIVLAFSKWNF